MSGEILAVVWPWAALALLGAVHGLNPGMGWLFAVALGLQERDGRAVWRALGPLAAGHGLAIVAAVTLTALLGAMLPVGLLKWAIAATLVGYGASKLIRERHPRFGGMTVGPRDLTIWSALMATAHGAGLMVVPFLLRAEEAMASVGGAGGMSDAGGTDGVAAHAGHAGHLAQTVAQAGPSHEVVGGLVATALHTGGYLLVTGLVAVIVYHKLGLRLLGRVWVNIDRIWAGALIVTGLVTPLL
jgi:hypothetical protein